MERTEEEVKRWLLVDEFIDDQDGSYDKAMHEAGYTYLRQAPEKRVMWVQTQLDASKAYRSYGDDYADLYQSGWHTAISWLAREFDWDEAGFPVNPTTKERLR
jgi:hypothetical protein